MVKIRAWGASDVGRFRKANEDTFVLAPDLGVVAVADGMGGFQRGDVASQLACNVVKETITEQRHILDLYRRSPSEATRSAVKAMLEMAVQRGCEEVHQAAGAIAGEGGRMGTTLDLVLVAGQTAFVAHVGDSRVYLVRGGECHQVTEDHSLVQQQLREGLITPEEAQRARFKNVITRALGVFPSVMVDTFTFELDAGDRLVLCSDGMYRYIGARELAELSTTGPDPEIPGRLVDVANDRGGRDNITAVLLVAMDDESVGREATMAERVEVLRRVDMFQYCTYKELLRLAELTQAREVEAGTRMFKAGDAGRECYLIESGVVAIERDEVRLAVLRESDSFGEMCFIDGPRRSADAVALSDVRLLALDKDDFLALVKQDSDLGAKLMWRMLVKLSGIVRASNERIASGGEGFDDLVLE